MSRGRRLRAVFVGRTRYGVPLSEPVARKLDALAAELDIRIVASEAAGSSGRDARLDLIGRMPVLDGPLFYLRLPFRLRRAVRSFAPDAIVAEDPHTAWVALRARVGATPVIAEVHGDPAAAARAYGSPARLVLAPLLDRMQRSALRRADAVRAVSAYTAGLVESVRGGPPAAVFPAYVDTISFETPRVELPEAPVAVYLGALERAKGVDVLDAAWPQVGVPGARLVVAGEGTLAVHADADLRGFVGQDEVARLIDEATVVVVPSRSEGFGRVIVEAFSRGRGVVASRVGGIPDLVDHGINGLLVPPGDPAALAAALRQVLLDRSLAERLGDGGAASYQRFRTTADEFARRLRSLVETALH